MTRTIEIWFADGQIEYRKVEFGTGHGCPDSFVTATPGAAPPPIGRNVRVDRVTPLDGSKVVYREREAPEPPR